MHERHGLETVTPTVWINSFPDLRSECFINRETRESSMEGSRKIFAAASVTSLSIL